MIKCKILVLLLTVNISALAQKLGSNSLHTLNKFDIGFGGIGYSYEKKLDHFITVDLNVGIGGSYDISEDHFNYQLNPLKPSLYASINPKFFFNNKKRSFQNKTQLLNSGNYFGGRIKYATKSISPNLYSNDILLFNIHWGLQRAISKRFLMNFHSGIGYADNIDSTFDTVYPSIEFKFSYVLKQ